jgi:hypothetical protein
LLGRIIASVGIFGYILSILFWWIAGNHFNAMQNKKGWSILRREKETVIFYYENI